MIAAFLLAASILRIAIYPEHGMIDQPLAITIQGSPGSRVSINLTAQRFGMMFVSRSMHDIPSSGELHAPMRLFWTALAQGPPAPHFQFARDTDLAPIPFSITVTSSGQRASASGTRIIQSPRVIRTVVDRPGLVATLFESNDGACRPGVLVLGGSEGGVPEEDAAVLASHGLTTLALAYFGAPGLSRSLTNIPIEKVRDGVEFLEDRRSVCPRDISLYGASKGAELALVAATHFAHIRSVVVLKPASYVFSGLFGGENQSSWTYGGSPLPFANGPIPTSSAVPAKQHPSFVDDYLARIQGNTEPTAMIRAETIMAPILLIAGTDDHLWPSALMAKQVVERRKMLRGKFHDVLLVYANAGHHIGVPYQFEAAELAHSFLDLGGTAAGDEAADEQAWPRVVEFLGGNSQQRFRPNGSSLRKKDAWRDQGSYVLRWRTFAGGTFMRSASRSSAKTLTLHHVGSISNQRSPWRAEYGNAW